MSISLQGFPWKRLFKVGLPFWLSTHKWKALGLLGAAIVCVIAKIVITVYINDTNGSVWSALKEAESENFWWYLKLNIGLIILMMPFEVIGNMSKTVLAIIWRRFLSSEFFAAYFAGLAALKLELDNQNKPEDERIDNAEWRMTAESDSFTNTAIGLFFSFFDALLTVGTMAHVLWKMSPLLTGTNVAYALFGWALAYLLGRTLAALNARQQKAEGDLRAGLTESRNQAATIAAYRAQEIAEGLANKRQDRVVDNLMKLMRVNRNMQVFTALYYPLAPLVPLGIMGALYLHDPSLDFGVIARAQGNFNSMFGGMSVIVGQFGGLSLLSALANRLGTLMEFLQSAGVERLPEGKFIRIESGENIVCKDLTVTTADGTVLVDRLNLATHLQPGEGILIRGPQATAKSALLNAIIGIWPYGDGVIERPLRSDLMIITQQPFMQPMSLRTALCYPASDKTEASEARLREVLQLVDLGELVDADKKNLDLDTEYDWRQMLSVSKQQRLGMARIINKKPRFLLIDEAANAMEAENEKLLITLVKTLGLHYFIAGNGADLVKYAAWVLEIAEDGSSKLLPAAEYEPTFWRKLERLIPQFLLTGSDANGNN